MTKRNLLLVSLLLVFGLLTMAPCAMSTVYENVTFTFSASANQNARAEGLAEAAGPVILTVSQVVSNPSAYIGPSSYFEVTYGSPIANITKPYEVDVIADGTPVTNPTASLTPLGCSTVPAAVTPCTGVEVPITGYNFELGDYVKIVARLNSSGSAGSSVALTFTANITGGSTITGGSPQYATAMNVHSLYSLTGVVKKTIDVLTCIGTHDIDGYKKHFAIIVEENFADALTSSAWETTQANTGVTNGSDIVITFSNVPAGLKVWADDPVPCSVISDTTSTYYCGYTSAGLVLGNPFPKSATSSATSVPPYTVSFAYDIVSPDNTTITGLDESVLLPYGIEKHGQILPTDFASDNGGVVMGMTATLAYVEVATYPTTPNPVPYFTGVAEPWSGKPANNTVVDFDPCRTYLLFPYINAVAPGAFYGAWNAWQNFGTGIVIANTTTDPFGASPLTAKGSAIPQSGSCTLTIYPTTQMPDVKHQALSILTGTPVVLTTPTIPTGGIFGFDVNLWSQVSAYNPVPFGGQGYGIAICNFQNATGYTEIYDNQYIGPPGATLAYLAYVMPDPTFYHRSPAGDGLGEFAIAPINVYKTLLKDIMLGKFGPM